MINSKILFSLLISFTVFSVFQSCSKKTINSEEDIDEGVTTPEEHKEPFDLYIMGKAYKGDKTTYYYFKNNNLNVGDFDKDPFDPIDFDMENGNVYVLAGGMGDKKTTAVFKNKNKINIKSSDFHEPSVVKSFNNDVYILSKNVNSRNKFGTIFKNGAIHQELTSTNKEMKFTHLHVNADNITVGGMEFGDKTTMFYWKNNVYNEFSTESNYSKLKGILSDKFDDIHLIANIGNNELDEISYYLSTGPAQDLNSFSNEKNQLVTIKELQGNIYILAFTTISKHVYKIKVMDSWGEKVIKDRIENYAPWDIAVMNNDIYILAVSTRDPSKSVILKNGDIYKEMNADSASIKLFPYEIGIVKH